MDCPKCSSKTKVKCGFVKDVQRYKCKDCGCQYTRQTHRGRAREPIARFPATGKK